MLALAHKIQQAIDRGAVQDRAEVSRRLGLMRARITQLLDLTLLAPNIQEWILLAEAVDGLEPISERRLWCHVPRPRGRPVLVQRRPPGLPPKCPAAGRPRGGS